MEAKTSTPSVADAGDMYARLAEITRQLHLALRELGYDRQLQASLGTLPDAQARLSFIARLTGDAAEKVLNAVDAAHAEQDVLQAGAAALLAQCGAGDVPAAAVREFASAVQANAGRTATHLTDIMLAQDFHDLTGQTVRRLVEITSDLERSLLQLLLEATPAEPDHRPLEGPVAQHRPDCVSSQAQVDDLLSSLGF